MKPANLENQINPGVPARRNEYAARFAQRDPFRHVVIDDFLEADYAARLLAQFPAFERGNALNEAGEPGNKSTVERVRNLGPAFTRLDDLVQSREFLDLIGHLTGIPDLIYDPWYFGGGTHENKQGQDLDAHVDFNRHPIENWHRRLNLIVYLNPEWEDCWGGTLELHTDPRSPDDQVTVITPSYNRCVIFETTESSWHGFSRIAPPSQRADITRRSIALYFYTNDRPIEELADTHSTIYVDQPLPARFKPGIMLTDADLNEIRTLLARRDQHNQRLYRDLTRIGAERDHAQAAMRTGLIGRIRYVSHRIRSLFS